MNPLNSQQNKSYLYGILGYRSYELETPLETSDIRSYMSFCADDFDTEVTLTEVEPSGNSWIFGLGFKYFSSINNKPIFHNFYINVETDGIKTKYVEDWTYNSYNEDFSAGWGQLSLGYGIGHYINQHLSISANLEYTFGTNIDYDICDALKVPSSNYPSINISIGLSKWDNILNGSWGFNYNKPIGKNYINSTFPKLANVNQITFEFPAMMWLIVGYAVSQVDLDGGSSSSTTKGCHVFGKIRFVEYGEDYKVRFVSYGGNLKVRYVNYGADSSGEWKVVDYGEDYKIRVVQYGEDFKVREVSYGEGCN